MEIGEAAWGFAVEAREIEVHLPAGIGAIGEEGDGGGVWRPGEIGFTTGLSGRGCGDKLALADVVEGCEVDLAALRPSEALAVRSDSNLADGKTSVEVGQDLIELGRGGEGDGIGALRADRQGKSCAEEQRQNDAARPEGWHRGMLAAESAVRTGHRAWRVEYEERADGARSTPVFQVL